MYAAKDIESYIRINTRVDSPTLCPEIRLHLIKDNAPMRNDAPVQRGEPHLFDWEGPRPYWAFAWAGGQALARFILDNPEVVEGKTVVDFGAGSGICAIAAAKSGAAFVTATDIDPIAIEAIKINARLNNVRVAAVQQNISESRHYDWDVFLAADAFYNGQDHHWLLRMADSSRTILFGDPSCRGFPKVYCDLLDAYTLRTYPELETWTTNAQILRLKKDASIPHTAADT